MQSCLKPLILLIKKQEPTEVERFVRPFREVSSKDKDLVWASDIYSFYMASVNQSLKPSVSSQNAFFYFTKISFRSSAPFLESTFFFFLVFKYKLNLSIHIKINKRVSEQIQMDLNIQKEYTPPHTMNVDLDKC